MWQYTSAGTVPGVSTGVDLSVAYKDYADIIQRAGLGQVRGETNAASFCLHLCPLDGGAIWLLGIGWAT